MQQFFNYNQLHSSSYSSCFMNSGIFFYSVSVYLGLYLGQISYFEKLSNVLLYCFHRLERRSPGSRKQYGLVIDGASLSLVFKGPYTGKSIVFVWMNGRISSSRMAAFSEARYRTRLSSHRNIIYTYERLCCRWFFLWTLRGTVHHWDNFSLVFLIRMNHVDQAQCHRDIHKYT